MTGTGPDDASDVRQQLLDRLLAFYGDGGPRPDVSMRQLATAVGTSHTMLNYYFGSWSQLTAAVLAAQRRQDNAAIAKAYGHLSFDALLDVIWNHYSDDQVADRLRAFFHVSGLAVYDLDSHAEFTESLADLQHILAAALVRDGMEDDSAERYASMAVAGQRGLKLQLLLGADKSFIDRAVADLNRLLSADVRRAPRQRAV